jgi:hypothetical protein
MESAKEVRNSVGHEYANIWAYVAPPQTQMAGISRGPMWYLTNPRSIFLTACFVLPVFALHIYADIWSITGLVYTLGGTWRPDNHIEFLIEGWLICSLWVVAESYILSY